MRRVLLTGVIEIVLFSRQLCVLTAMQTFTNGFTPLYVFLNRICLEEKTYSLEHGILFTLRWNSKLYPVCG